MSPFLFNEEIHCSPVFYAVLMCNKSVKYAVALVFKPCYY